MQVVKYTSKGTDEYALSEAPNFYQGEDVLDNAFKRGLDYSQVFALCLSIGNQLSTEDLETMSEVFKRTAQVREV